VESQHEIQTYEETGEIVQLMPTGRLDEILTEKIKMWFELGVEKGEKDQLALVARVLRDLKESMDLQKKRINELESENEHLKNELNKWTSNQKGKKKKYEAEKDELREKFARQQFLNVSIREIASQNNMSTRTVQAIIKGKY
jgi:vacuolar-type H+-ATPase subunit I/STV1